MKKLILVLYKYKSKYSDWSWFDKIKIISLAISKAHQEISYIKTNIFSDSENKCSWIHSKAWSIVFE